MSIEWDLDTSSLDTHPTTHQCHTRAPPHHPPYTQPPFIPTTLGSIRWTVKILLRLSTRRHGCYHTGNRPGTCAIAAIDLIG